MISDVLSDAVTAILRHLDADKVLAPDYVPDDYVRRVAEVVLAMERTRLSHGFNVPPDFPEPELPTDAMLYLKQLLAAQDCEDNSQND
jgi:hypothetical protein